jgi:leader peptidase (prepilin peptidase) / N-methyltransferase
MCPCEYPDGVAIWQQYFMGYLSLQELAICVVLAVLAALIAAAYFPVSVAISTLFLTFVVAAITISDVRHFIIPDVLSLPAIPAGVLAFWFASGGGGLQAVMMSVLGALLGGASLYVIKAGYERVRHVEGLGLGDVKLFAAGGAWLGPGNLAVTLLLASLAALIAVVIAMAITGRRGITRMTPLPFGAFIAPAIWLVWIYQQMQQIPSLSLFGV